MYQWSRFAKAPALLQHRGLRGISSSAKRAKDMETTGTDYTSWSSEKLVGRVTQLEHQLKELNAKYAAPRTAPPPPRAKNARANRKFDPSQYSTRLIALKFAYLGQRYNGFEYHANNQTPLPTVEEALWKALDKAKLIFPTGSPTGAAEKVNFQGCEYSKCGRTDRGVSAFGQVIGIRVRSNKPLPKPVIFPDTQQISGKDAEPRSLFLDGEVRDGLSPISSENGAVEHISPFDPIKDEICYTQILNRLLPPDIRILGWCPSPPADFSARFSCGERRYRYFFTQPIFNPTFGAEGLQAGLTCDPASGARRRDGWLNIKAMEEAAKLFEGLHDFRNFCKVDPSKQIDNFERTIFRSGIEEVIPSSLSASFIAGRSFSEFNSSKLEEYPAQTDARSQLLTPKVYSFTLHGSGFLWHQVRHMIAILFCIGQGLEKVDLITQLLDVQTNPQKPLYEMADDAPLVLWDCIFPRKGGDPHQDGLEWLYVGDQTPSARGAGPSTAASAAGKYGTGGVADDMWKIWRQKKMDEVLAGQLLNLVVGEDRPSRTAAADPGSGRRQAASQKLFLGGNAPRLAGTYVPVLERPRMEPVDVVNRRYAARKGFEYRAGARNGVAGREGSGRGRDEGDGNGRCVR